MENIHPLPDRYGKTYILRLLSVYNFLWKEKYGFNYTANIPLFGKAIKQAIDMYNEIQIATLLVVFFNWYGLSGSDDFEHKKVAEGGFAIFMFLRDIAKYEIYIRNILKINFDDIDELKGFLSDNKLLM